DPRLPHGTPEEMLSSPSLSHQRVRAGNQRAEWTAKTLREAERDRVEAAPDPGRIGAGCDGGVDETRAVPMECELVLAARRDDRVDLFQRPDGAAGAVVRVLDGDHARRRNMHARPVPNL